MTPVEGRSIRSSNCLRTRSLLAASRASPRRGLEIGVPRSRTRQIVRCRASRRTILALESSTRTPESRPARRARPELDAMQADPDCARMPRGLEMLREPRASDLNGAVFVASCPARAVEPLESMRGSTLGQRGNLKRDMQVCARHPSDLVARPLARFSVHHAGDRSSTSAACSLLDGANRKRAHPALGSCGEEFSWARMLAAKAIFNSRNMRPI